MKLVFSQADLLVRQCDTDQCDTYQCDTDQCDTDQGDDAVMCKSSTITCCYSGLVPQCDNLCCL